MFSARSFNGARSRVASIAAETVGDDGATFVVYLVVGVLVVIGAVLVALAVWLWRVTKPDRELLAPLELMDDRAWRREDPQGRRRSLDEVRPDGASPLRPSVREPSIDQEFDSEMPVVDFADLTEPLVDPLVIDLDDGDDDGWEEDLGDDLEAQDDDLEAQDPVGDDLTTAIASPDEPNGPDGPVEADEAEEAEPEGSEADENGHAEANDLDWDEASDSA